MTRLALLACVFAACSSPAPTPPANTATPPVAELRCGAAVCAPTELCESRFKGHSTDDEGRPLERTKCMPVPDACRATPTCACVTQHLSATHCTDADGRVQLDDYPK